MVTTTLTQRLLVAGSPSESLDWDTRSDAKTYIDLCQLTAEDIPELIELAMRWIDERQNSDDDESDEDDEAIADDSEIEQVDEELMQLLPVTAWRGLAELGAIEAIKPLLSLLESAVRLEDDWVLAEFPRVFGRIGKPAIESLRQYARGSQYPEMARYCSIECLANIGLQDAASRDSVSGILQQLMEECANNPVDFNSSVLVGLVDIRASEAAEAIERAFAGNFLDSGMLGDWEAVRKMLGVEGLGLEMPLDSHNSMNDFRSKVGINCFSEKPLFLGGELDESALEEYLEVAMAQFTKSPQGIETRRANGDIGWTYNFLELAVQYPRVTVNNMTCADVEEILFELFPRKVSVDPGKAPEIILELTQFWTFVDRVHKLRNAPDILQFLQTATKRFRDELANPENYGMAKGFFMLGQKAGFDMRTPEGMNAFRMVYNQSLRFDRGETSVPPTNLTNAAHNEFMKKRKKILAAKKKSQNKR